jgi:hypothetical protein
MSDEKWQKVDAVLRKQESGAVVKAGGPDTPLAPIDEKIEAIRNKELFSDEADRRTYLEQIVTG